MKSLFIIILLYTTFAQAQWEQVQIPVNDFLRNVYFIDDNIGFIVGSGGVVLKTTDSGTSWKQKKIEGAGSQTNLYSIYFVNNETGWIAGDFTIAKTTDSGETWVTQTDLKIRRVKYKYIYFVNSEEGIAFSDHDIYQTNDGGNNWNKLSEMQNELANVIFRNSTGWYLDKNGYLFKTNDKVSVSKNVARLHTKYEPNKNMKKGDYIRVSERRLSETSAIYFIDELNGWAIGERNLLYRTKDGGENWSTFELKDFSNNYNAICFVDKDIGWISKENEIYKTENGGENWVKENLENKHTINSIFFLRKELGFVVCEKGVCYKFKQ